MHAIKGKWLVGVSGGPDSMALLEMCIENHMHVMAAHVNYHHRKEADEEEAYVRSFCQSHHIPCTVRNEPFVSTGNFEADARNWRYSFFLETVRKYSLDGVLIAHQEDDLIETYFMQEERNLIPAWYGLKEQNDWHGMKVVRPLLSKTKKDLQNYCDEKHVRYYIDSTNADDTITRNRIRHHRVEGMNRDERNAVLQEIQEKNRKKAELEQQADALIMHCVVSLQDYRKLPENMRDTLLRRIMEDRQAEHHMSLAFLQETDNVLMKKNDFVIPVRKRILVQDHGWFFLRTPFEKYRDVYTSPGKLEHVRKGRYVIEKGTPGVNACSVTEEDFPLTVRSFQKGDAITMRYGTKKVHRFFIDRHIPLYARETWPVVLNCRNEVILVPGLGCDAAHYTVTPDFNVIEYRLPEGEK